MIKHATSQVIALAAETRGEEFATGLRDAMGVAAKNGWTFAQAGDYACRLIFRSGSSPRELIDASQSPIGPVLAAPPDPETVDATIAAMKARAEEARLAGKERERLAAEAAREAEAS